MMSTWLFLVLMSGLVVASRMHPAMFLVLLILAVVL